MSCDRNCHGETRFENQRCVADMIAETNDFGEKSSRNAPQLPIMKERLSKRLFENYLRKFVWRELRPCGYLAQGIVGKIKRTY
jgi:hypothetical protein